MMRVLAVSLLVFFCTQSIADTVVPSRTLRAHSIITSADLLVRPVQTPGAISDFEMLLGQETRVTLYAGRPIRSSDVGPPAVVDRNQIVTLHYSTGAMRILVDGRSLGRGGPGDRIRVMNLASRATLFGVIEPDGTVKIGNTSR